MKYEFSITYNSKRGMVVVAADLVLALREAGFNIYMSIKHEHSIIISLSYLLWALRAWSFCIYIIHERIYVLIAKTIVSKMASSEWRHYKNFPSCKKEVFMIFYNLYIFCNVATWHIIGSQACNLMHCFYNNCTLILFIV